MVNPAERSDVDISKLFVWGNKFSIKDRDGGTLLEVYIRLVGDADINRARVAALRRSAELRKRLNDPLSDERVAYIPEKEFIDKDALVEFLLTSYIKEKQDYIAKEVSPKQPKEPGSNATLEAQENYQKEVDSYPERREKLIREKIEKLVDEKRSEYNEKTIDQLYSMYERERINFFCENEYLSYYRDMCVFFGTFKDPEYKEKFFDNIDELLNLSKDIKDQFIVSYMVLEIGGEELKNWLGAMP